MRRAKHGRIAFVNERTKIQLLLELGFSIVKPHESTGRQLYVSLGIS